MTAAFEITFDGRPVASTRLESGPSDEVILPVGELEHYGFQVVDPEPAMEYRVAIGDDEHAGSIGTRWSDRFIWQASNWFESARGRVTVWLGSRNRNSSEMWETRAALV